MTLAPARTSVLPDRITTPTLRSYLRSVPSVDEVGASERVAALSTRSIKRESKRAALDLMIRMMDLTTLEGKDTPGKVIQMCAKAYRPDPTDPSIPSVAAVCIYPNMVPYAVQATEGTGVHVASVATYFPSGLSDIKLKVEETKKVVADGADEVDMVIDRGAFLAGEYFKVFDEIRRTKDACGDAHLKVILETGELETLDNVRRASMLAMAAGGDFIKTSTGKVSPAATLPVTLVMLEAIRDFHDATGVQVGMKPAGGIRTSKDAMKYLLVLNETLGEEWMTPDWFRFGASSLAQRRPDADPVPGDRPLLVARLLHQGLIVLALTRIPDTSHEPLLWEVRRRRVSRQTSSRSTRDTGCSSMVSFGLLISREAFPDHQPRYRGSVGEGRRGRQGRRRRRCRCGTNRL